MLVCSGVFVWLGFSVCFGGFLLLLVDWLVWFVFFFPHRGMELFPKGFGEEICH